MVQNWQKGIPDNTEANEIAYAGQDTEQILHVL